MRFVIVMCTLFIIKAFAPEYNMSNSMVLSTLIISLYAILHDFVNGGKN